MGINLIGTRGWDGVGLGVLNQWLRDVTRHQLSKFFKGISPVRSISRASTAVKALFAPTGGTRSNNVGSRGSSGRGMGSRRPSVMDEAIASISSLTAMSQRVSPIASEVNRRVTELTRRLVVEAMRQSQAISVLRVGSKGQEALPCPEEKDDPQGGG